MVLQHYSTASEGRSIQRFGSVLTGVGTEIYRKEKKREYNDQVARAEAKGMKLKNKLYASLYDDLDNPEQWESNQLKQWWSDYERDIVKGIKDPNVIREIQRDLPLKRQAYIKIVRQMADRQMKVNADSTLTALNAQIMQTEYPNETALQLGVTDYTKAVKTMVGKTPKLQNDDLALEVTDENISRMVRRYLLSHPDKEGVEGYWIEHPNEFAEKYGLNSKIGRKLFTDEEVSRLKKEYQSKINDMSAQRTAEKKAIAESMEIEINNDILKLNDNNIPSDQKLTRDQIRQKIIKANEEGVFISGEQSRVLSNFLDSKSRPEAEDNDSYALAEAYRVMATDMTQQQKFNKIISLSPKLKSTTTDSFIKDIYEPESATNDIYKQYSSAINSLKTGKMFSKDITENINLSLKAQDLLKKFAKQNPDATEDDYAKFFNRLIENQTSFWGWLPGGKSFWHSLRREKGEIRYSIPRNIEALTQELGTSNDLSSLSDEELLKRIMGK